MVQGFGACTFVMIGQAQVHRAMPKPPRLSPAATPTSLLLLIGGCTDRSRKLPPCQRTCSQPELFS